MLKPFQKYMLYFGILLELALIFLGISTLTIFSSDAGSGVLFFLCLASSILFGIYLIYVYNYYSKQDAYQPSSNYKPISYKPQNEPKLLPPNPIPQTRPEPKTQQSYEKIGKIRNRTLKDLGWSEFFNYTYDDSVLGKMTNNEFHEIEMRLQYKKDHPSPQNIIPPQKPQKNNIPAQSKNYRNITIDDIDKMEGTEFENFLKILFENMGYSAEITKHTIDMGADLILSKSGLRISVQAKRWSANVGNDAIQAVVGSLKVYKTQRGMVVTNSDFTNPAIYQAHHCDVELWNRDKLIEIINKYPVNK